VFLLIGVLVGATVVGGVGGVGVIAASTTKSVTVCANKKQIFCAMPRVVSV
jgi:hypothetical protein